MKILYVTTISNTVNSFLIPHIRLLAEKGHQVDVAFNIVQKVSHELTELGCVVYDIEFQRSPLSRKNYSAYKRLKKLIEREKYDIVHSHTPVASTCVRIACRNIKNLRVYYTAHGFHFFRGAPVINWLFYYPVEKYLSRYTDLLITINKEDYKLASRNFFANKTEYIPGIGLDIEKYNDVNINRFLKRSDLGIPDDAIVLLSVGELNPNKNHETVIRALAKIDNPNIWYLICGVGQSGAHLENIAQKLGVEKRFKLLGYRKDTPEIYKASDIFVFPSLREGLPVSLLEAMAAGMPVVCSNIRGNNDLIEDRKSGFLVKPQDYEGFANAIRMLIDSEKLKSDFSGSNLVNIEKYSLDNVLSMVEKIYDMKN